MDERIIIKVLALTGVFSSPSTRLRIIYMSNFLEKFGIKTTIIRFPKNIIDLIKVLKDNEYDLIWLQKKMPDFSKYLILKLNKKPIIFDFDDNLIVRMKLKNGSYKSKTREVKFFFIKNLSTGFTCGNKFLEDLVKKTNKPTIIYPTPVPINVPKKNFSIKNKKIKIGWIGLSGGFMYLDKIFPQLQKLHKELDFQLVIISDKEYRPKCNFIKNIKWQLETQESEIAKFDFGIMPLNTNSPYDKGKCAYKILQYMAGGVIPIAEAYGTNLEVIKHGENGFLIYDNLWYEGLKDLILKFRNREIDYQKISNNAIKTVKEKYSFESLSYKLVEFFKWIKMSY